MEVSLGMFVQQQHQADVAHSELRITGCQFSHSICCMVN